MFFGATVRYSTEDGTENTVTIVGIDEVNPAAGLRQLDFADCVRRF